MTFKMSIDGTISYAEILAHPIRLLFENEQDGVVFQRVVDTLSWDMMLMVLCMTCVGTMEYQPVINTVIRLDAVEQIAGFLLLNAVSFFNILLGWLLAYLHCHTDFGLGRTQALLYVYIDFVLSSVLVLGLTLIERAVLGLWTLQDLLCSFLETICCVHVPVSFATNSNRSQWIQASILSFIALLPFATRGCDAVLAYSRKAATVAGVSSVALLFITHVYIGSHPHSFAAWGTASLFRIFEVVVGAVLFVLRDAYIESLKPFDDTCRGGFWLGVALFWTLTLSLLNARASDPCAHIFPDRACLSLVAAAYPAGSVFAVSFVHRQAAELSVVPEDEYARAVRREACGVELSLHRLLSVLSCLALTWPVVMIARLAAWLLPMPFGDLSVYLAGAIMPLGIILQLRLYLHIKPAIVRYVSAQVVSAATGSAPSCSLALFSTSSGGV